MVEPLLITMVGHSAFDRKLLYLEKLSLYNNFKPCSFTFSIFCEKGGRAEMPRKWTVNKIWENKAVK